MGDKADGGAGKKGRAGKGGGSRKNNSQSKKAAGSRSGTSSDGAGRKPASRTRAASGKRKQSGSASGRKANGAARSTRTAEAAQGVRDTLQQALSGKNGSKLTAAERRKIKSALEELRSRVNDEVEFLSGESLNSSQRESSGDLSSYGIHMADQGTDSFERDFTLSLVSNEQDLLYEIDEALQRLLDGNYGFCESCGEGIEKPRLQALPFARMCIKCKSEEERGRRPYRPFGNRLGGSGH